MSAVLIVEDDADLRAVLALTLRARKYRVLEASNGADGARQGLRSDVDVVVLDLGLPDMDGIAVISRIREASKVPIIVLSARRYEVDKVRALDAGADDYLTKPFGVEELAARIRVALRRSSAPPRGVTFTCLDFVLDLGTRTAVRVDGTPCHLTPTEWSLVEVLVRAEGQLVSSAELLHEVWGPGYEEQGNYLRVYIGQLRRKLEPHPSAPTYLLTSPGAGYRLAEGVVSHE